jgi:hypothetical protein
LAGIPKHEGSFFIIRARRSFDVDLRKEILHGVTRLRRRSSTLPIADDGDVREPRMITS